MGIEPWLGYGQWYVAAKKGFSRKQGLTQVDIVNFTEDKDINAALASGQLDAANIATHTAMGMVAAGLPVKIVSLLDFSLSADAILAGKDVKTHRRPQGQERGLRGGDDERHPAQLRAAENGMTLADVKPVPMPAADAGSALHRRPRAGRRHLRALYRGRPQAGPEPQPRVHGRQGPGARQRCASWCAMR